MFRNNAGFKGEELLAPRPNPKLEDHPLSPVGDCIFTIFTATFHIGGHSSIRILRTRRVVVTGTQNYNFACCLIWVRNLVTNIEGERRLRVFENRVLRSTFGPKKGELTREWRKLHNEELNDLYCSPNIVRVIKSRRMRRAGHLARMGERRGVYRVLVGKPEGKRQLGRPRRRWEFNIKMDLQEAGCWAYGLDRAVSG
jgi:hypothetical protein